jgi:trehalose synthase-fused probable maltokinase
VASNEDRAQRESFSERLAQALVPAIPEFLLHRRWFGGKSRSIRNIAIRDLVRFEADAVEAFLVFVNVHYASGPEETYTLPLLFKTTDSPLPEQAPSLTIQLSEESEPMVLYDAMSDEKFLDALFDVIAHGQSFVGTHGKINADPTTALPRIWEPQQGRLPPVALKVEQSNSSVVYGKKLVLKLFRRLEQGTNPDLEIGLFLTEKTKFRNVPAVAGHMEYLNDDGEASSVGILQAYVPNQGDAWQFTLNALNLYYEQAKQASLPLDQVPTVNSLVLSENPISPQAKRRIGSYLDSAALLGRRTAELHLALASASEDPDFSPAPFSEADQREFSRSALGLLSRTFGLLRQKQHTLSDNMRPKVQCVLDLEKAAESQFDSLGKLKLTANRARIHGDYHLGQVLFTGDDFVIIDFEGEPARSLAERRAKRSPLQDVAGMLRSFHYAAYAPILSERNSAEALQKLDAWARFWHLWVSATFLRTYLDVSGDTPSIPRDRSEMETLLAAYLLDKAVYELGYELNNRPLWVAIPLQGILNLLVS